MRELSRTELFLLAEGESLKNYIDGDRMYKAYKELKAEIEADKPQDIPKGKRLMADPFVGYVLVDVK